MAYAQCRVTPASALAFSTLAEPMVKGSILAPIVRIFSFCGIWQTLSVGLVQIFYPQINALAYYSKIVHYTKVL